MDDLECRQKAFSCREGAFLCDKYRYWLMNMDILNALQAEIRDKLSIGRLNYLGRLLKSGIYRTKKRKKAAFIT